ncbi:unnamed protein product [Chironomus riparius]|uniref:Testin n=1 Tax=Chironomus riparius TaxID=315576 RepID=A0A9N9RL19_9DIPT|nr:unnamed protein product [Chironomus riparius]
MENISKLEERLEQSRKQRKILKHELGAGKSCLSCKEKCVGGLNLHFWRKICINCKCPKSNHDLLPEDYDESHIFDVLGVKIPDHKNLYKYIRKNPTTHVPNDDKKEVEWIPIVSEMDDAKRNEKINKYFEELGEKQIPFKNSDASKNRKIQSTMQLPPHDFNPEKCDNLSEIEASKLKHYVDNLKRNYFGQGQVDVVENSSINPFNMTKTNLNAINNNENVAEMFQKLNMGNIELLCRGCGKDITGAFVKAERLGKGSQWHPKCFKCKSCSQLLVDLIYFHYNNEIYCARDLAAIMEIPRCAACDELILVSEFTLADNKNYHLKHFCCGNCDKTLAGFKYVNDEKTNNPVCLSCYDLIYANKCSICTEIIAPNEEGLSFKEIHYHLKCFNCSNKNCNKQLIGSRFCIKADIPFCSASCVNSVKMTN